MKEKKQDFINNQTKKNNVENIVENSVENNVVNNVNNNVMKNETLKHVCNESNARNDVKCDSKRKANNVNESNIKSEVDVKIAVMNVRGYRSKMNSIDNIADKGQFNFIMISETQIPMADRPKSKGSLTHFHRNRDPKEGSTRAKGGVSIAAGPEDDQYCTITGKGTEGREYISIKSNRFTPPMSLYCYYGRQESKVAEAETTNCITELFANGRVNANQGDVVVIAGDFNLHVGKKFGLQFNDEKVSKGGTDLEVISKKYGFTMMNSRSDTQDHSTHQDSTNNTKRALDFIFVNNEAVEDVEGVYYDEWENPQLTPYRVMRRRQVVRKYTDHRTLWMKMKLKINKKARSSDRVTRWRVTSQGLAEYYNLTEKYAEHIIEMAQDEETSTEEVVDAVYNIMEKCKEEAYDKVTKTRKKWKELDDEIELENYSKQLNSEIMKDRLRYKFNAKLRTYAARKRILLDRRGEAPFALQREDGTKAVTYEERAETLANYNRKLLGRNPHPGEEKEEFERRKRVVKEYMEKKEDFEFESEITIEDYMWAVDRISQKKKPMFNDFLRSHPRMKAALYWIVRRMYKEETVPSRFLETELIPLFKGKGSPADPGGYRYLHVKSWGARLTEMCIFKKVEELFDNKTPEVQLGGMKERSTLYHLLTVNETARKAFKEGGGIVVTLIDCQKMFDSVHLDDIAYEMVIEKIDPKALRNLYNFSDVNILHVQGSKHQWFIIPGGVGQGSVSGARGCSFLVAKRLDRQVGEHPDPLMYADVNLTGQAFVDDVIGLNKDAKGCRSTATIFSKILDSMGLLAHNKKSVVIVCGTSKYVIETKNELEKEKAIVQGHELSVVEEDAYLGIMLCQGSPSAQVTCNINMKRRKVACKLNETLATLRKDGVKATGYLNSALTLVEGVIRPSMTYGMETMITFNKGQQRAFNQIWKKAITKILNVPDNVTTAALFLVLNIIPIYAYVLYFKMILIQCVFQRKDSRIYNILRDQYVSEDTGCMVEDVLETCRSYNLPDIIAGPVSKNFIRDKVFEKEMEKLTLENNEVKSIPYHNYTLSQDMSHLHFPKREARAYLCYRLGLLQWLTRRRGESMRKYGSVECPCRTPQCVQEEAEDNLEHATRCGGYQVKFSEKSHDPKWELSRFLVQLHEERARRWPWLPDLVVYPDRKQTPDMTACDNKDKRKKEDVVMNVDSADRININNNNGPDRVITVDDESSCVKAKNKRRSDDDIQAKLHEHSSDEKQMSSNLKSSNLKYQSSGEAPRLSARKPVPSVQTGSQKLQTVATRAGTEDILIRGNQNINSHVIQAVLSPAPAPGKRLEGETQLEDNCEIDKMYCVSSTGECSEARPRARVPQQSVTCEQHCAGESCCVVSSEQHEVLPVCRHCAPVQLLAECAPGQAQGQTADWRTGCTHGAVSSPPREAADGEGCHTREDGIVGPECCGEFHHEDKQFTGGGEGHVRSQRQRDHLPVQGRGGDEGVHQGAGGQELGDGLVQLQQDEGCSRGHELGEENVRAVQQSYGCVCGSLQKTEQLEVQIREDAHHRPHRAPLVPRGPGGDLHDQSRAGAGVNQLVEAEHQRGGEAEDDAGQGGAPDVQVQEPRVEVGWRVGVNSFGDEEDRERFQEFTQRSNLGLESVGGQEPSFGGGGEDQDDQEDDDGRGGSSGSVLLGDQDLHHHQGHILLQDTRVNIRTSTHLSSL